MNGPEYYGLTGNPFDKNFNCHGRYFESEDFRQAEARLNVLKTVRGIGVITAESGMGKSLSLKAFTDELNPNLYHAQYICFSTVTVPEFYRQLCDSFGLTDVVGKTRRVREIKDQIQYMYTEKKQTMILILDEAQYLNTGILNDLKMLMNFNYDTQNYFTLILCGEPLLKITLSKPVHMALRQRVPVHYEFKGLQDSEVKDYILFKLKQAGGTESMIDPAAINSVTGFSHGNPRLIDNLMTDALTIGAQQELKSITADVIMAAEQNRSF